MRISLYICYDIESADACTSAMILKVQIPTGRNTPRSAEYGKIQSGVHRLFIAACTRAVLKARGKFKEREAAAEFMCLSSCWP